MRGEICERYMVLVWLLIFVDMMRNVRIENIFQKKKKNKKLGEGILEKPEKLYISLSVHVQIGNRCSTIMIE